MLVLLLTIITWFNPPLFQSGSIDPLVRQLIVEIADVEDMGRRIELVSERLLGRPYLSHPLIGSPETAEVLVTRVDGFDCVTLVETVLAIAHSESPDDFPARLSAIRYRQGQVEWRSRLHYATQWSAFNIARGILDDVTTQSASQLRLKSLDRVRGLDPHLSNYRYYPKRFFPDIAPTLLSGDIIFFVSGRPGLDTNHVGIVIRRDGQLLLRNASRSHRAVVDQSLEHYFETNRMAGFFVNRPRPLPHQR